MGLKVMVDIKGELFDMWEVRTITRHEEYNGVKEGIDYGITLNREGKATNAENIIILFDSIEERDTELKSLKERLNDFDTVIIL